MCKRQRRCWNSPPVTVADPERPCCFCMESEVSGGPGRRYCPSWRAHHEVFVPTSHGHAGGPELDSGLNRRWRRWPIGLEAELDRLGLKKVHSPGTPSVAGWASNSPRRAARSLVLLSPAGAWRSPRRLRLKSARSSGFSLSALARYSARAESIAQKRMMRWAIPAAQVQHPHRVPRDVLATYIHASGRSPSVVPLLRVLHRRPVDPLPAERDYPIRLVWAERDRVLPFKHFGSPMLERLQERS